MNVERSLRPSFHSLYAAVAFTAALAFFLILPLLPLSKIHPRPWVYEEAPLRGGGAYAFIGQEIFEKNEPIDILFLGSSVLWSAIDTPAVKKALSQQEKREATVLTFGTNWRGEDLYAVLLEDLLARRRVKLLVFDLPKMQYSGRNNVGDLNYYRDEPHNLAHIWWDWKVHRSLLQGLSLKTQAQFYAMSVLGGPRRLLSVLRRNPPPNNSLFQEIAAHDGAMILEKGYRQQSFHERTSHPPQIATKDLFLSNDGMERFRFTGAPWNAFQMHFLEEIRKVTAKHGVQLVILTMPTVEDFGTRGVAERTDFRATFPEASWIGVPAEVFFSGFDAESYLELYLNGHHLNRNGARLFTEIVTPALLEDYAQTKSP